MKKMILGLLLITLVGCSEKVEPIKDTVDTINESKISIAEIQVNSFLKEAEMKWLSGLDESCISVSELSSSATGFVCRDDNYNVYAKDIQMEGLICNGYKTDLKCVGENND